MGRLIQKKMVKDADVVRARFLRLWRREGHGSESVFYRRDVKQSALPYGNSRVSSAIWRSPGSKYQHPRCLTCLRFLVQYTASIKTSSSLDVAPIAQKQ